jgi:hypothetical protein
MMILTDDVAPLGDLVSGPSNVTPSEARVSRAERAKGVLKGKTRRSVFP